MTQAAVLIVEDEALIRMESAEMVQDAGFAVVEAHDADAAIRILELRRDILVVFSDISMPGSMDGLRLAHTIHARWPSIHLLLTSGLTVQNDRKLPKSARFIAKPYSDDQILAALSEVFSTGPRQIGGVSGLYRSWRVVSPQLPV
jgi:CheY-like chemotaxis protein